MKGSERTKREQVGSERSINQRRSLVISAHNKIEASCLVLLKVTDSPYFLLLLHRPPSRVSRAGGLRLNVTIQSIRKRTEKDDSVKRIYIKSLKTR